MKETVQRRLRFSLRRLLIVVSVAVLVLSHGLSSYRLFQAQKEIGKLRRETGFLEIIDSAKIHVVAVPVMDTDAMRWRVYIPPGTNYQLALQVNEVSIDGFQVDSGGSVLQPGITTIELRTVRESTGDWTIKYFARQDGDSGPSFESAGARSLQGMEADWLAGHWPTMIQISGVDRTESFDVGKEVLLLRQRAGETHAEMSAPGPARGILFWLIPDP